MSWVAAAVVGGAVIGGVASNAASENAADAATANTNNTLNTQLSLANQSRADQAPYQQLGYDALPQYYAMLGITPTLTDQENQVLSDYAKWQEANPGYSYDNPPPYTPPEQKKKKWWKDVAQTALGVGPLDSTFKVFNGDNPFGSTAASSGNPYAFQGGDIESVLKKKQIVDASAKYDGSAKPLSPLAQWQMQEGTKIQNRQDASRGLSGSGGASARIGEMGQQIAGQDYQNSYLRILDALKVGTGAAATAGLVNQNAANAVGSAGAANTNIIMDRGQSEANMWSGLGSAPMDFYNVRQSLPNQQTQQSSQSSTPSYII